MVKIFFKTVLVNSQSEFAMRIVKVDEKYQRKFQMEVKVVVLCSSYN